MSSSEAFAAELRAAEERLRATGLTGQAAFAALCRHLADRLGLPAHLKLPGPDAPEAADLGRIPLTADLDLFGLAYERFFPEVFKAEKGQFFTPRPLIELMVDLVQLRRGERVLDPTCGSGSFLLAAWTRGAEIDGIEVDPELVGLCRLNLALHGADPRAVRAGDLFREPVEEQWEVILANPPYSMEVTDAAALEDSELAAGRSRISSDVLFLEAAWRRLVPGGRLAALLPYSMLGNPSTSALRTWMSARFERRAVVSLPEGIFRPFGGAASRAAILILQKRPAEVRPWVAGIVRHPGYDPTRKVYKRTQPDELASLRLDFAAGRMPRVAASEPRWVPEAILAEDGMAPDLPTLSLGELAPPAPRTLRPADRPDEWLTEIDLADVDKQTGEVTAARTLEGAAFTGAKSVFFEGDLIFSRLRPNLNTVALVRPPRPGLPADCAGSSEWAVFRPTETPAFALVAARSPFARAQLVATGGQTRPRVRAEEIAAVRVPDPGPEARALIDRIVGEAMAQRHAARIRMDQAAALYDAHGRSEIDREELVGELRALRAQADEPKPPPRSASGAEQRRQDPGEGAGGPGAGQQGLVQLELKWR